MLVRLILYCCALVFLAAHALADEKQAAQPNETTATLTESAAVDFVQTYCIDCHQADDPQAGLNLAAFASAADVTERIETWNKIANRIRDGEMPPAESELPSPEARAAIVEWVFETIHAAVCDDGITPGPPQLRRLNRTEYANTLRDLLGIQVDAGHALPAEGGGGEGFDNAAEILFISPMHAEKYLDAARSALSHAFKDPEDLDRIIIARAREDRSPQQAARRVIEEFLPKAFRRSVDEAEIEEYVALFDVAHREGDAFDSAIQFALQAALMSPKFLFLYEQPNHGDAPVLISQYEMASRMSYFMWASMPDEELLELASAGRLHDETVLAEQVERMLKSATNRDGLRRGSKVREFATSFTEQWLGTRALGREFKPDASIAREYDSELEGGMKYEPIFFFEDLLADNRSLLNLIDSDFTYVNRRLARHYGVKGEFREQPKKVDLPADSHRGGVLGMSAVLAVSSFPHRTSPVLRGKWILETLLGSPPPPPPPGVPLLEETSALTRPTSVRERLELHRADAACAACHASLDPLGFGLENFDVLGQWRTQVDGVAIDARGELPDGTTFDGPDSLKKLLLQRKQQFIRNLTSKMLGYALARGLNQEDQCVVDAITETLAQNDYLAQTLIFEIVKSVPFRYKQGQRGQGVMSDTAVSATQKESADGN